MPARAAWDAFKQGIRHPLLKLLFEHWEALEAPGGIALKSRFDPIDLPAALWPRLHMIRIPEDDSTCRNAVLGGYVVGAVGRDFTGRRLLDSEIPGVTRSVTYGLLQRLLADPVPQYHFGPSRFARASRFAAHEQILLPLADATGRVNAAIGALDYHGFSFGLFDPAQG